MLSDLVVGRPESLNRIQERKDRLLEAQRAIRPAAKIVRGKFVIVSESKLPQRLVEGFKLMHSGVLEGFIPNGEPSYVMRSPQGE